MYFYIYIYAYLYLVLDIYIYMYIHIWIYTFVYLYRCKIIKHPLLKRCRALWDLDIKTFVSIISAILAESEDATVASQLQLV